MMFQQITVKKDGPVTSKDYSLLTEHAMRFRSDVLIEHGSHRANAKSIMGTLALGLKNGAAVTVVVKGDDEREALDEIVRILQSGFRKA